MYLSRLIINNYRSIKRIDLRFEHGKNVIVGRNNAGKSNIIRAIDLVLGESSPTYQKYENVSTGDFYYNNLGEDIVIYCELQRGDEEQLNYEEMYKCIGFYKQNARLHLDDINLDTFLTQLKAIFTINPDNLGRNEKTYVNPKLRNQSTFENEFGNMFNFAFVFIAHYDAASERVEKELCFLYRETDAEDWNLAFRASIRNELLQSAIIPSFRDPFSQLKISNWSWYGKLLRNCIDPKNPALVAAFQQVKEASNEVFNNLHTKINNSRVKIAFPETTVSFQFNPDTKHDVYSSALIYVDDGFLSKLQDKGAGIQSAVIIGMFDFYTREVAHVSSSLLAIEEPELYLHPHGRRVISNRLDDFLDGGKNQVIVTTHSSEFINSAHENLNIIVVSKDKLRGSVAHNASFKTAKEKQILIRSQNAEMFFADAVILVEGGGDKYTLETIAEEFGIENGLGANWLNDHNISVIPVIGKCEFCNYVIKLKEVGITHFVMADFDCVKRGLSEFLTKLNMTTLKTSHNSLNGKICQQCPTAKSTDELPAALKTELQTFQQALKQERIILLNGNLEYFYTDQGKQSIQGISGKEEAALHLVGQTLNSTVAISTLIKCDEQKALLELVRQTVVPISTAPEAEADSIAEEPDATQVEELPF